MTGVPVFVLDAGALIALERAAPAMTALLARVRAGHARLLVPDAVVAQVWRGGTGRQARIAVLLGLKPEHSRAVPLDTTAAKRIGSLIRTSDHADVVDVQVAMIAMDNGAAVITSDRDDITAVSNELADRIIDV